jgi:sec-independent protein translocase protein TatB
MFEFGFGELVLVFMIGLLVLGPQRLPKVAAEIGKWVGRARRTATQLRRQLEREIELADLEAQQKAAPPLNPPLTPPQDLGTPALPQADSHSTSAAGSDTISSGAATEQPPATPREISDAISAHSTSHAPASGPSTAPVASPSAEPPASPAPQVHDSTDKPPVP